MIDKCYTMKNKIFISFLCIIMTIINPFSVYAIDSLTNEIEQMQNETPLEETAEAVIPNIADSEYVYFDLYYGDVTISGQTYKGYVLENGVATQKTYSSETRKIYVYQSNGENTIWENGLPKYDRVQAPTESGKINWGDYITNNTNVANVITNWQKEATAVNRKASSYRVNITGTGNHDITLDNLWSSYHQNSTSRVTGGFSYYPNTSSTTEVIVRFKGDNRFGNIFYATGTYTKNKIIFAGEEDSTVTVANLTTSSSINHYNSAIGGTDSAGGDSIGMVFESGIIYAGTTYADNCSAIGGGGNAKGDITINGGTITAVVSSTGTAIGGGIGYSSNGGNADVKINDGMIYAYNFGYEKIPSAAIGGGSSRNSNGNASTTVTITGGNVYAQCTGGVAIGGGGSQLKNGGHATVNISGGSIIAKSVGNESKNIEAGSGIGGGTGVIGGNATLNISGDAVVKTGSIGG